MSAATLTPRLVVRGADQALEFYRRVFDAQVQQRFADETGHVFHAGFSIGGAVLSLTEERSDWNNVGPAALGGSPVILSLDVDDVDRLAERLVAAGAEVVIPVADQPYGRREGRFRDPFGHLWIVSQVIEVLTDDEIRRRMAAD